MAGFDKTASILDTIKRVCNVSLDESLFDQDLIMFTNMALASLHQLGVGPSDIFSITDNSAKWENFLADQESLSLVIPYVSQKVRLTFDPPVSAHHLESMKSVITEMEQRLLIQFDLGTPVPVESED